MKLSKVDKAIAFVFIVWAMLAVGMCFKCSVDLKNAGGAKQVVIDAGKEMKDIARQIGEDE